MRNTPSFFGDFPSKQKPKRCSSPPPELKIEKEADLREKKKKILQRLKKNVDPVGAIEESSRSDVPVKNVPEKVIFSPKTSKRFLRTSQNLIESGSGNEIKRLERAKTPLIILQKPENEEGIDEGATIRLGYAKRQHLRTADLQPEFRNEDESVSVYVPSFTEKPLRHLSESPTSTMKKEQVPESKIPTRKKLVTSSGKNEKETRLSLQSPQGTREVPLILTEKDSTNQNISVSDDDDDDDNDLERYVGSPFRRSASFHSLKDRHQAHSREIRTSAGRCRQFLKVDDQYGINKASSLSSLYDNPSRTSEGLERALSTSSTSFAKLQQQKLEEDFHRVEENLDRTFSELRKYLRTS